MTKLSDRIKRISAQIKVLQKGESNTVYYIKVQEGKYSCQDLKMTWADEVAFRAWTDDLQGNCTLIIDAVEDAIKYPDKDRERRRQRGLLTLREIEEEKKK